MSASSPKLERAGLRVHISSTCITSERFQSECFISCSLRILENSNDLLPVSRVTSFFYTKYVSFRAL